MKFCISGLLIVGFLYGFAQEPFPPIGWADVTAHAYPLDTTAEAIILSDYCEMKLADNRVNGLEYQRRVRIKILRKSGYKWATVTIPFFSNGYRGKEFVRKIKGQTFNADGQGGVRITPLAEEAVFEEKESEKQYAKRFTLPDVREGSVIEYSYSVLSEFVYLEDWLFQREIPVIHSECRLLLGAEYPYKIVLLSSSPLAVEEAKPSGFGIRYRWVMTNIPAFKEEPHTACARDYVARIQFRSVRRDGGFYKTWQEFDQRLTDHSSFGKAIASFDFFQKTGKTLKTQYPDTLARVTAVHNLIKQRMAWDGTFSLWSDDLQAHFNRRKGDCADINFLVINLLRATGLEAYPVLLSTRTHGSVQTELPSLAWFNYVAVVTRIGGKEVFLDATMPFLPVGMLPPQCLNQVGRVIDGPNSRWIPIASRHIQGSVHSLRMVIEPDGSISGEATTSCTGYVALLWRTALRAQKTGNLTEDLLREIFKDYKIDKTSTENMDSLDKALVVRCVLRRDDAVQRTPDRFYFTPLLAMAHRENLFRSPTRSFPIDFGSALEETSVVTFILPKGYSVEELPKAVALALPGNAGRFTFAVSAGEHELQVTSRLQLRKPTFAPDEYPALRAFFDNVVAKHAEQVVLKKEH